MKALCWQLFFLMLCIWDTTATQIIVTSNITSEGNPLMATVIETSGWIPVWAIKLGFGSIFVAYVPTLWYKTWGKPLVFLVYSAYIIVAGIHIFILQLP